MKVVFFGTPDFVLPLAETLNRLYNRGRQRDFIAVVTQPPKPVGRKKQIVYSPIDRWAYKHNIAVIYDFNDIPKADLGITAAYGRIIPESVIDMFSLGIVNVHPSLLPSLRGASPIQAAIALGLKVTGVSVIKMDAEMDHGPILSSFTSEVGPDENSAELRERLFRETSVFIESLLPSYVEGKVKLKKQDHEKASFTIPIQKKHAFVPGKLLERAMSGKAVTEGKWEIPFVKNGSVGPDAETFSNFIRAMQPWPVAWTNVRITTKGEVKRLKINKAHLEGALLVLDEVQLEGKNIVNWKQFNEGYPNFEFD